MNTLVLSHADVVRNLQALSLLDELRAAFAAHALHVAQARDPAIPASTMLSRCAGVPVVAVHSHVGERHTLLLHDAKDHTPLAVMDGKHLAAVSQAVLVALAVDVLAGPQASRIAVVGASATASITVKMLRLVRTLAQVRVFDGDKDNAHELAHRLHLALHLPVRTEHAAGNAVEDADIVLLMENAPRASVPVKSLMPGALVVAVDALAVDALDGVRAWRKVQDVEAAGAMGLSRVLQPGAAASSGDVTLMTCTAPGLLDALAGWHVLSSAQQDTDIMRLMMDA